MYRSALLLLLAACNGTDATDSTSASPAGTPAAGVPGGSTGSGTPAGTPGGTTTPTFPIPTGWQRVDLSGGAIPASVDASIGDDGAIYVSWAAGTDVFVAQSSDGGTTWSTPVQVDGPGVDPQVGPGRNPYVHVGPDTLWVTFNTSDATQVKLYRSELASLAFTEVSISLGAAQMADYAKLATDASGGAWLTWLSYDGGEIWPTVAREANNFATEEAGNLGTLPCECCRNDLFFSSSGAGFLLFRNNDVPLRDIWAMRAAPGAANFGDTAIQVSRTNWQSYVCPMQGPRMAELGNGDLIAAWTDPTAGPWQVWTVKSTDDGLTWAGDARAATFLAGEQRSPAIAAEGTTVWLTVEGSAGFTLLESTDSGATFTEREALNAGATELETGAGMAIVVGANPAGEVVLQRLQ